MALAAARMLSLFPAGAGPLARSVGLQAARTADVAMQVRHMSSGKEVKNRMKSVGNIRKITKSMQMVAASRLKGAQTRMEKSRPFGAALSAFVDNIGDKATAPTGKGAKQLVVVVSSDRGLCGGINSSVVKATKVSIREAEKEGTELSAVILGDKAKPMLAREYGELVKLSTADLWKKPMTYLQASVIADKILSYPFDSVLIVYNKFKSVIQYDLIKKAVLASPTLLANASAFDDYEFEGERSEVLQDLFEFNLANSLYTALLENATSEQGARMTAMDNATSNAGDMMNRLQLTYNRTRQSQITTELIEIISGAESLKG